MKNSSFRNGTNTLRIDAFYLSGQGKGGADYDGTYWIFVKSEKKTSLATGQIKSTPGIDPGAMKIN